MAMHSYMRANQNQTSSVKVNLSADEINNFLKDKQAWEHAISLYQGPDPLDHWYNYICWYENHAHSDPELKFRETLERCLTVYEHNEYYRQDVRLVRLWLKYIAMQTDQLRFYQVLFQRGTGRQVAAFYISWASYYETREQFKDAEAVFNLAFQEKAHSNAELQNAHSKFTYVRSLFFQQQPQPIQPQPPPHDALQQLTTYTEAHHQQEEHNQQQHAYTAVSSTSSKPHHFHEDNFHQCEQQPQPLAYLSHSQQQQQQVHRQTRYQDQSSQPTSERLEPQFYQSTSVGAQNLSSSRSYIAPIMHQHQSPTSIHYVPQLQEEIQQISPEETLRERQLQQQELVVEVAGVRLPRNFQAFGRNNHESWKPALTLEEPDDPSRVCHYAKQMVYPVGAGVEYSPEELLAQKYAKLQKNNVKIQDQTQPKQLLKKESSYPAQEQHQFINSYHTDSSFYMTAMNGNLFTQNAGEETHAKILDENDEGGQPEQTDEDSAGEDFKKQSNDGSVTQVYTNSLGLDFRAQTYEQQNRSIKMKFKKERTLESSTYSAYTIESIYHQQQELPSPAPPTEPLRILPASPKIVQDWTGTAVHQQRNGNNHFHPYLLGHTSTPKSTASDNRRVRARAKLGNFQPEVCSNSNSSCSVVDHIVNGVNTATAQAHSDAIPIHNATFNDNANFSFSSAGGLDNSNNSLSTVETRLDFHATAHVVGNNKSQRKNSNIIAQSTTMADFSTFQENSYFATQHDAEAQERRLSKALETIERHLDKEAIDPFNSELCRAFLVKLNFPGDSDKHASYKVVQTPLPKISNTRTVNVLENMQFNIDKEVGRGSYGSVYKATDSRTGNVVALKFQKPPNTWEIYICDQVLRRISDRNVLPGLMDISTAIIAPNASLIATQFSPFGSLLDINNKIRQATTKVMHESLVMHFSAQICNIVDHLHRQSIIHADIKPDNFLLMRVPSVDKAEPSLRLIDFGCAIDMSLFPDAEHMKFRKVVQTDGFTCIEMQEGRPWSYETDLFCIASTVHVMLFGEYMQPQKRASGWEIRQKLPRYLKKHVWSKFFCDLLNMEANKLPQLQKIRNIFEEECYRMDSELQKQIRTLSNILHRR